MEKLKELFILEKTKKDTDAKIKAIKSEILEEMKQYDSPTFEDENIKVTYVKESSSKTVDLKLLEKEDKELFDELLDAYPKVTVKSENVRTLIKKK